MKQIMLLEDDKDICDAVILSLSTLQYQVNCFADDAQLSDGSAEPPDLFIIDKNLSGKDGVDICRFLKAHAKYKHLPVLLMSADPDTHTLALLAGANGAIIKPFRVKTLKEAIANYI
ncbi:MAG: response regulator transcription factor [Chitinophagaceae bacterium]|nr:response regulator transcription factor [Chitinophagaceae bacterium]